MGWLAVFIPVGLIVLWVFLSGGKYKAIFAGEHLVEVATLLQQMKDAAYQRIGEEPTPPADDRCTVSSARIASFYTVDEAEDRFVHRFSISIAGSITPHAVGRCFTLYFADLLGIPFEKLQLAVSENHVFHCGYDLSEEEHMALKDHRIEMPKTAEEALRKQRSCSDQALQFEWAKISGV